MDSSLNKKIDGLSLYENFIDEFEHDQILDFIKAQKWDNSLKRRTQHYGYNYSYGNGKITKADNEIPENLMFENYDQDFIKWNPNQLIVNEYTPGQGISAHIDSLSFGEKVVSISLGAEEVMDFTYGCDTVPVVLHVRSAVELTGDARYKWRHQIKGRRNRGTRISLTYRCV